MSDREKIIECLQQAHRAYTAGELSQHLQIDKFAVLAVLDDLLKEKVVQRIARSGVFPKFQLIQPSSSIVLSDKEADAAILKSLSETKYQSSKNLAEHTGLDGLRIIERLDDLLDDKVNYKQVGTINVWFLTQNAPQGQLINSGNGSYFVKETKSKDLTPTAIDQIRANIPNLEKWAAEGKTYKQVAELLNVNLPYLQILLASAKCPEIKAAWQKGKAQGKLTPIQTKQTLQKTDYSAIPVTPEEDEAFEQLNTYEKPAQFEPQSIPSEKEPETVEESPEVQAEAEVQTDSRFERTIEHLQQNGHSDFEPIKTALVKEPEPQFIPEPITAVPPVPPPPAQTVSKQAVTLTGGGTLIVGFDGNMFEMSKADRVFINEIIDKIQERNNK